MYFIYEVMTIDSMDILTSSIYILWDFATTFAFGLQLPILI